MRTPSCLQLLVVNLNIHKSNEEELQTSRSVHGEFLISEALGFIGTTLPCCILFTMDFTIQLRYKIQMQEIGTIRGKPKS